MFVTVRLRLLEKKKYLKFGQDNARLSVGSDSEYIKLTMLFISFINDDRILLILENVFMSHDVLLQNKRTPLQKY